MIWIIIALVAMIMTLVGLITYIKRIKEQGRPKGAGMGEGLGAGMLIVGSICFILSEFCGYHEAWSYSSLGLVLGCAIGAFLERRYQRQ